MKAQLSIDFVIALTLFVLVASFFLIQLLGVVPSFLEEMRLQQLRSNAYSLSELLVSDAGEPEDWETRASEQIKRIGLRKVDGHPNLLSLSKVQRLGELCEADYTLVQKLVGMKNSFSLEIRKLPTGESLAVCFPIETKGGYSAKLSRNVVVDGLACKLSVEVYG